MARLRDAAATLLTRVGWRTTAATGQGLAEYALILGLVAVVVVVALTTLGSGTIQGMLNTASSL
jgi:Flp pilus assembly pilin Flp